MNRWILPLFLLTSVAQATPLHPAAAVALQAGADAGLIEYKQRRPSPVVKREFVSSNLVVSIQEDGFVYTNRFSKTGMSRTVLAPRFLRERVVMDISILLGADVTDDKLSTSFAFVLFSPVWMPRKEPPSRTYP